MKQSRNPPHKKGEKTEQREKHSPLQYNKKKIAKEQDEETELVRKWAVTGEERPMPKKKKNGSYNKHGPSWKEK